MKISKQSDSQLVLKAGARTSLLVLGLIMVILGLLAIFSVRVSPVLPEEVRLPSLLQSQQRDPSATEQTIQTSSATGFGGLSLGQYLGEILFSGRRVFFLAGVAGISLGLLILVGPHSNRIIKLDKATQTVTIKHPGWFFRKKQVTYPFRDITEVRVERNRETRRRSKKNYRVDLVISHSEGAPLSRDYIHYKTIFPLTEAYRSSYQTAKQYVDEIQGFLT
jgi:hypothetical protein